MSYPGNTIADHEALAVVIPYHSGSLFLDSCLASVWNSELPPARVYLIDNDPAGLPMDSPWRTHMGVQVIRTQASIGFGRAVNIGVYTAVQEGYRYFLVLNQDTKVDRECLQSLIRAYMHTTGLRVVSAMIGEYDQDSPSGHFRKYILGEIPGFCEDEQQGKMQEVYTAQRLFGTCFLLGVELVETIALFDPVFYMYGEDDDLGNRIHTAGGRILLSTPALVRHKHSLKNATGKQKQDIRTWMLSSRLALRIRYTGISKAGYILRCLRLFAGSLLVKTLSTPRPVTCLRVILPHLHNWNDLKQHGRMHVQKRIDIFLREDQQQ